MKAKSVGFIGAGRVARIILGGLKKAGRMPEIIVASDTSTDMLKKLQSGFPEVQTVLNNNHEAAAQELVFLGLHPPAIGGCLADIQKFLKPESILVSLAPKLSVSKLMQGLGGFNRIVRMIPNAASVVGEGYNPVFFSQGVNLEEKEELLSFLGALGKSPEVEEDKLEAYAIVTAMGPTYLWFQWQELRKLAESFGITPAEVEEGMTGMITGAANTLFKSGLSSEEVIDLIPVKPLGEEETIIKAMYESRLRPLYEKLKS